MPIMYIYMCVCVCYIYIHICMYIYICLYTLLAFVYQHDLSPHHVFSRILLFQLWGLPYINIWEQLIIIANTLRSFNIAMEAMAHRKRWFMTIYLLRMVISRGYVKLPEHVHIYNSAELIFLGNLNRKPSGNGWMEPWRIDFGWWRSTVPSGYD